jgi:serine/threonine protein kinase
MERERPLYLASGRLGYQTIKMRSKDHFQSPAGPGSPIAACQGVLHASVETPSMPEGHQAVLSAVKAIEGVKEAEPLGFGGDGFTFKLTMYDGSVKLCKTIPIDVVPSIMTSSGDLKEAYILGKASHPALAKFEQVVPLLEGTFHAIVLEYIPGRSLRETFIADGKLTPAQAENIFRQMLDVLKYLHEPNHGDFQGPIYHRDIKPENIILASDGSVKLVDFGAAHTSADNLNATGSLFRRTHGYCNFDFTAHPSRDLYALATTITEALLTLGAADHQLLRQGDKPPYFLAEFVIPEIEGVSDRFRLVLQKMKTLNREDGFQSAQEVLDTLDGKIPIFDRVKIPDPQPASFKERLTALTRAKTVAQMRKMTFEYFRDEIADSVKREDIVRTGQFKQLLGRLIEVAAMAEIPTAEIRRTELDLVSAYQATAKGFVSSSLSGIRTAAGSTRSAKKMESILEDITIIERLAGELPALVTKDDVSRAHALLKIVQGSFAAQAYLERLEVLVSGIDAPEFVVELKTVLLDITREYAKADVPGPLSQSLSNVAMLIENRITQLEQRLLELSNYSQYLSEPKLYLCTRQELRLLAGIMDKQYPEAALKSLDKSFLDNLSLSPDESMLIPISSIMPLAERSAKMPKISTDSESSPFGRESATSAQSMMASEREVLTGVIERVLKEAPLRLLIVSRESTSPKGDWIPFTFRVPTAPGPRWRNDERKLQSFYVISSETDTRALTCVLELLALQNQYKKLSPEVLFTHSIFDADRDVSAGIPVIHRGSGWRSIPQGFLQPTQENRDHAALVPGLKIVFPSRSGGEKDSYLKNNGKIDPLAIVIQSFRAMGAPYRENIVIDHFHTTGYQHSSERWDSLQQRMKGGDLIKNRLGNDIFSSSSS